MRKPKKLELIYKGAIEGFQEKFYFERLQELINHQENSKYIIKFRFKQPVGGDPLSIVKKASEEISYDEKKDNRLIAVFDYDGKKDQFVEALNYCQKEKIQAAYSNFSFDIWLLLHKKYVNFCVSKADGYDKKLKEEYMISSNNLKEESVIKYILQQISLQDIVQAIKNAERIDSENESSGSCLCRINEKVHYEQPSLSIHYIVKDILIKCGLYE